MAVIWSVFRISDPYYIDFSTPNNFLFTGWSSEPGGWKSCPHLLQLGRMQLRHGITYKLLQKGMFKLISRLWLTQDSIMGIRIPDARILESPKYYSGDPTIWNLDFLKVGCQMVCRYSNYRALAMAIAIVPTIWNPDHLKSRPFKIRMFLSRFQMVFRIVSMYKRSA